jgi:2-dehydropantoate 2-reductase
VRDDLHYLLRRDYQAVKEMAAGLFRQRRFSSRQCERVYAASEMGEADVVLVGLKTFANQMFGELILLSWRQNHNTHLAKRTGQEESLAALSARPDTGRICLPLRQPGEPGVHHLGEGRIIIGEHGNCETGRVEDLANCFSRREYHADLLTT